jgi:septal ring factor EnvC (AmiA/AmiB activator)
MFKNHQIPQLKAQIKRLKREKAQLRAFLHEIIEAHYRVINQEPRKEVKDE